MVAGVAAYRRSKAAATAKLDPPPHHFSGDVAGRDHLGFEEDDETSPLAPELKPLGTGVDGYHRLKVANHRRSLFAAVRGVADVEPPPHHLDREAQTESTIP